MMKTDGRQALREDWLQRTLGIGLESLYLHLMKNRTLLAKKLQFNQEAPILSGAMTYC